MASRSLLHTNTTLPQQKAPVSWSVSALMTRRLQENTAAKWATMLGKTRVRQWFLSSVSTRSPNPFCLGSFVDLFVQNILGQASDASTRVQMCVINFILSSEPTTSTKSFLLIRQIRRLYLEAVCSGCKPAVISNKLISAHCKGIKIWKPQTYRSQRFCIMDVTVAHF